MDNPALDLKGLLALTLVTGRDEARPRTILELAERAFAGGVTALQLREKNLTDREFYDLASPLAQFCRQKGRLFIINDRLDIALAVAADGLHLGVGDLPIKVARAFWPRPKILGATAKTVAAAKKAEEEGADYLGCGALFPSPSKPEAPIMALETLKAIQEATTLPLVGIGGVNPKNAALAWSWGLTGLAAITSLARAEDPERVANSLTKKPRN
ncbi:MAG: thiamine phosphate synthase [Deltaproteobacteria bacterium]|jgi:thiamine-phosphate pyrophosphorylase|nr:thiamine phosphate synthase [Deltaproteobacteria bacterium]